MKPGRFVSIPVYTLSFKEYLDFKSRDSRSERELLEEYISSLGNSIETRRERDGFQK